jgi:hypothetical protein
MSSSQPVVQSDVGARRQDRQARAMRRLESSGRPAGRARLAWAFAGLCAALSALAGCSGRGSFLSGGPTAGQLKTSLSHLEYENAQLKRAVAKLQQESRSMEDRLVQEEIDNGELTARLDDARNLLRDRGLDERLRSYGDGTRDPSEGDPGPRTLPAGQPVRKRRKPPVARIPGLVDAPSEDSSTHETSPELSIPSNAELGSDRSSSFRSGDDLDHHTYYNGSLRWTPIASGVDDSVSRVR